MNEQKDIQGEGNYDASRRHRQATESFVKAGKVEDAAERAQPASAAEADELERAEEIGRAGVPPQQDE